MMRLRPSFGHRLALGGVMFGAALAACGGDGGVTSGEGGGHDGGGGASSSLASSRASSAVSASAVGGGGEGGIGGGSSSGGGGASSSSSSSSASSASSGSGGALPVCDACVTIASLPFQSRPYGVFADDEHVFWTNSGSGEVMQAGVDGSNPIAITTHEDTPIAVFARDGVVYWGSYSVVGVLRYAPVGGGPIADLVSAPALREIHVGAQFIWWTNEPDDVQRVPLTGVPPDGAPDLLTGNTLAEGLAGDDAKVYWVDRSEGSVRRSDFDLTNVETLASGDHPFDVAVDDAFIYWTEVGSLPSSGKIMRASKVDGSGAVVLADAQPSPRGIAIDGERAFWLDDDDGTVHAVPLGGGADETIAVGQQKPINIAVNAAYVYWANTEGDAIVAVPK